MLNVRIQDPKFNYKKIKTDKKRKGGHSSLKNIMKIEEIFIVLQIQVHKYISQMQTVIQ